MKADLIFVLVFHAVSHSYKVLLFSLFYAVRCTFSNNV